LEEKKRDGRRERRGQGISPRHNPSIRIYISINYDKKTRW